MVNSLPSAGETDVVRFGILGCAAIARKLIRAMRTASHVMPYAVGSRSLQKAQAFLRDNGLEGTGAVAYGSYSEVLDDPLVHCVYVPLPTGLHVEWVKEAAAKKKHVLLEKPPALAVSDMEEMISACRQAGVQLMDGTMWVHNPRAQLLKQTLSCKEEFGKLLRMNSHFFFKASEQFLANDIRVKKGLDELGCLGDVGWYCIRAALWAVDFEMPHKVMAMPGAKVNSEGIPISCGGVLCWKDGKVATFDCGFDAPLRQSLVFSGTNGTVELSDFTIPHRETECNFVVEKDACFVQGGTKTRMERVLLDVQLTIPQEALMVECFADIVRDVLAKGKDFLRPEWPEYTRITLLVLLAVRDSLHNGSREVKLGRD